MRVLDNYSTGFEKNLLEIETNPKLEVIEGDIRSLETCMEVTEGMDLISHQAAIGSVPRSINDPITSNAANISGTLNIFHAAVKNKVKRVVFAASSSTYGDSIELPKREDRIGAPLSPYAVTKLVNELYAKVFADTYDFEFIGLRYFNVFGPNQDPGGAYAAVIPLFMKAALEGKAPFINGDGNFSRDFTYIENVVQANILSLFTSNPLAVNEIYNVAYGSQTSLNELWNHIKKITNSKVNSIHREQRQGDIPHSLADISKAKSLLGYNPKFDVKEGLEKAYAWYKDNLILDKVSS